MKSAFRAYFRGLYSRTMRETYDFALQQISEGLTDQSAVLDCGASSGWYFEKLSESSGLRKDQYFGLEWNSTQVEMANAKGLHVKESDLNERLPFDDETFDCVFGLSVLEHLLNGCAWMREAHRVLKPGGKLIVLTPNVSTYFNAVLLLAGKMPSSGPHPDSTALMNSRRFTSSIAEHMEDAEVDVEDDTPVHRHLVVFSYRELSRFLNLVGFRAVQGRGYGVYPFPNFAQPLLEKIDRIHAHQMVFVATK